MRYRNVFSRRTMLRGAGTVAIGLPFLDAMRSHSVFGSQPDPPVRAFNVFFGLGFPTAMQSEGYGGPLEPMEDVRDKMLIVRGVDHVRADVGGDNAHYDGATAAFNAIRSGGEVESGGPTVDQVLRQEAYPNGQPSGVISTLLMGTYFRRSRAGRYIHCWNNDGSPADLPKEDPASLFERIFGSDGGGGTGDPPDDRRFRYRRSILDSVVEQYRHYQSDASNLGVSSRARIADHLDRLREHEQRIFGDPDNPTPPQPGCEPGTPPGAARLPHGTDADPDGQGVDITLEDLVSEWRSMVDVYTLAIQCDMLRFGGITFQAGGERIRLTGRYEYKGRLINQFDDRGIRGTGGDLGCSHEFWHDYDPDGENTQLRAHLHLMMREVTYFLSKLDDPNHADENGLSILENALVSISTESGDGRHSDSRRELSGIFHAFSGAAGRLATGGIVDANAEGIDVYNTIIAQGFGYGRKLGPDDRTVNVVNAVLP